MKNTELRIGNYINGIYETEIDRGNGIIEDVESLEVVKVVGLDGVGFSDYSIWVEDGSVEEYDSFEPIPLTKEWLLKLPKDLIIPNWIEFVHELQNWYWVENKFKKELF